MTLLHYNVRYLLACSLTVFLLTTPLLAQEPTKEIAFGTRFVNAIQFSPDGKLMAAAGDAGGGTQLWFRVWNVDGWKLEHDRKYDMQDLDWTDNSQTIVGATGNGIAIWKLSDQTLTENATNLKRNYGVDTNGPTVAWGGADQTVHLIAGGIPSKLGVHETTVTDVKFSPDGSMLATSSRDASIGIWNVRQRGLVRTLRGHGGRITSIDFSPRDSSLASASTDRTVKVWDVNAGSVLKTLASHSDQVQDVAFSSNGKYLVSACFDGAIRIWDTKDYKLVAELSRNLRSVDEVTFSPDGRWLASGGQDGMIRIWDFADITSESSTPIEPVKAVASVDADYSTPKKTLESLKQAIAARDASRMIACWDARQQRMMTMMNILQQSQLASQMRDITLGKITNNDFYADVTKWIRRFDQTLKKHGIDPSDVSPLAIALNREFDSKFESLAASLRDPAKCYSELDENFVKYLPDASAKIWDHTDKTFGWLPGKVVIRGNLATARPADNAPPMNLKKVDGQWLITKGE